MAPIINPVAKDRIELGRLDLFDSMVAGILTLDDPIPPLQSRMISGRHQN